MKKNLWKKVERLGNNEEFPTIFTRYFGNLNAERCVFMKRELASFILINIIIEFAWFSAVALVCWDCVDECPELDIMNEAKDIFSVKCDGECYKAVLQSGGM